MTNQLILRVIVLKFAKLFKKVVFENKKLESLIILFGWLSILFIAFLNTTRLLYIFRTQSSRRRHRDSQRLDFIDFMTLRTLCLLGVLCVQIYFLYSSVTTIF